MYRTHSLPFTHEHSTTAPPPSSVSSRSSRMPTVFVHPPEDEAMPWCAFDASQENADSEMESTTSEMEDLQSRHDDWPQTVHVHPSAEDAAAFHRSQADSAVVMPRRHNSSHSSLSASRNPLRLSVIPESPKRAKERDDDDIVEIMKVRRGEGMPDVTYASGSVPTLRRSKTLRSRAAQALRSIKNVGKVPRRPMLEHVIQAKENDQVAKTKAPTPAQAPPTADKHRAKAQAVHTQSSLPRLKKRVSQPLSNLFGLGPGGSEASPNASDAIGANTSPSHFTGFRTLPYSRSASASTPALQLFTDEPTRPTSPSLSIRSTRQKFSFVNLQSIFSGSTPSAGEQVPEPQQAEANPEVDDTAPLRTVQTPVDEGWDSEEDYDSPRRHANLGPVRRPPDEESYPGEREFSFGMRLNSLHFEDFRFDADAF